jgi:pimeloyl-ACP methyl ester carboxylesterase
VEATVDLGWVHTWYAEHGSGDPLVYLHAGLSDASELDPVLDAYCELAVVPGTSHALVQEKPELVTRLVLDLLTLEPVPTLIPMRRR